MPALSVSETSPSTCRSGPGGRLYSLEVAGKMGWRARYLKEVDADEKTLRFSQEIYDAEGRLVEVHETYPIDRGHQKE